MTAATRVCEQCGDTFTPAKPWARYCSDACRIRAFREAKREANPAHALQLALAAALTAIRTAGDVVAALADVRREADVYEATHASTPRRRPRIAARVAEPEPTRAPAPDPRQAGLFDRPARAAKPARTLLVRYEDATRAGRAQSTIARAIGLSDGSTLSHWRKGRKQLSAEREKALAAWLDREGF